MTPYIIVCPDTYEFIYLAMLFNNLQRSKSGDSTKDLGLIVNSGMVTPLRAIAALIAPRSFVDSGALSEKVDGAVVGRWFNKRIAIMTQGNLYRKLSDLAEAEIAKAKLAEVVKPETEGETDWLLEGILDAVEEPIMEDDEFDRPEDSEEDKEEFVPTEPEYTNITALVRNYLVTNNIADPDIPSAGAATPVADAEGFTRKRTTTKTPKPKVEDASMADLIAAVEEAST